MIRHHSRASSRHVLLTTCVNADGDDINEMCDRARDISFGTFLRYVTREELRRVFPFYSWGRERGGLRLANDRHVTYHRSVYRGMPVVFAVHSAIEYVFGSERTACGAPIV